MIIAGVDLGGRRIAISMLMDGEVVNVSDYEVPKSVRHYELRQISSWAHKMLRVADMVVIEEPYIGRGTRSSMALIETLGAVLATLGDTASHTRVDTVPVATWKKETVGKGNADKAAVGMWLKSTYPSYSAMCGANQDRIDAACIGLYGAQLLERSGQLGQL